jgi:DNA-directed RNA polymerase specialized sigma24 family protein
MATGSEDSVTGWLDKLRSGDEINLAAREIWRRYFRLVVQLARVRLRASPRGMADEEDVAVTVMDSFYRGVIAGRFPRLAGRDDVWRLLATITARKASNQRRRALPARGRPGLGPDLTSDAPGAPLGVSETAGLDLLIGHEPGPESVAQQNDLHRRLLDALRDDSLRQVVLLKMEGYQNAQIAIRLGCGLRTVERKLDVIRKLWGGHHRA